MSNLSVKSIYSKFQTDPLKETQGVDLDLGVIVITCARAGGSNAEFEADFQKTFAPYNQVMDLGEMSEEKARELTYGVYARTICKRWRYRNTDTLEVFEGMGEDDDGKAVPMTPAGIIELFRSSHDLFVRVRNFAQSMDSYLIAGRASAAKN